MNEAENIPRLVNSLQKWNEGMPEFIFQFVFIDDGSTDNTSAVAKTFSEKINLTVLKHEVNKGPGAAFATGFSFLSDKLSKEDLVVTMEGDNTSRPEVLKIMLGRVEREGAEVVLASPYAYGGGMTNTSFFRVLLSHVANGLMKILLNFKGINTFSSFYRLYTGETVLQLQKKYGAGIVETKGFECMVELLYKIILFEFSLSEVPMKLDTALRAGKSKMKVMRTIRGYFRIILIKNKWK